MEPPGLIDRLVSLCLKILGAALALYVAACLVESVWLTLAIAAGVVCLGWVGVVVYKTMRDRY